MRRRPMVVLAAMGGAALAAAAAPVAAQVAGGGAAVTPAVAINDAGYLPDTVAVAPGGHISWKNGGVNPHTVTSDTAGVFDSGTLNKNQAFELTAPAAPGTYAYHCSFHAFMHGTLVVSTLTLQGPKKAVLLGTPAIVRGAVPGGAAGTPVAIESLVAGVWTPVASTALAADGTFRASVPGLKANASVRAHVGADISPGVEVLVAPKVTLKRSGPLKFAVTVKPAKAAKAALQRLNTDTFRWSKVRTVAITGAGRAKVTVPKPGVYRIEIPATKTLAVADSPSLTFR